MRSYIKKNKYDVYNKIIKVIDSCKTYEHCFTTETIINNFLKLYDDFYLYDKLMFNLNLRYDVVDYIY